MKIVSSPISVLEIKKMAADMFGDLVKAVIDVEREIMVLDGELHADEEALLLENGSQQKNLWGINIYPDVKNDNWIEFDSMINLRPSRGNKSRGVDDAKIRKKIIKIINKLIKK